ncbi:MAG: HlyD family efflux transporter periplasmic adaptor subunit [Gammaproteobacteria bacterium]
MTRALVILVTTLLIACDAPTADHAVVGTLEREPIALSAELAEPIRVLHVREGDRVAAGDLLVELDAARSTAEHARLAAQRDRLQGRLAEVERGPRAEQILEARARLLAADAAKHEAELQRARVEELRRANLASERDRDSAQSAFEQASGARDAARAALDAMLEGATAEEHAQARAALAEVEAAIRAQQVTLDRLVVRSPRVAIVEALPFEVGETPRPGAIVARLRATDTPPYARVYVPAALHAQLAPGARVRVTIDGHGEFDGTVRYLSGEAAFTPYYALTEHDVGRLSYLAEIDVDGADALPSGIPVRVVASP